MALRRDLNRAAPPDFLTVEEAAVIVRVGRTVAYRLAQEYLATNGRSGLPVLRYGRQLRVPRCKLEEALGGAITWPPRESRQERIPDRTPKSPPRAKSAQAADARGIPNLFSI